MAFRKHLVKNMLSVMLVLGPGLIPFQQSLAASATDENPSQNTASRSSQATDQSTAKDRELKRLQSILTTLNLELESTYHQFQMVQEARRGVVQSMFDPRPGLDPRSYDEMVKEREQAVEQEKRLSNQMNQLLDKAREIQARMDPILERVYQLIPDSANYQQTSEEPTRKPEKEYGNVKIKPIPH